MTAAGPLRVVVFGPARSGKTALAEVLYHHVAGRGVRLFDADGQTAGKLMAGEAADAALAAELIAADALVLVVDAAADPAEIDRTFAGFATFLHWLEQGRAFSREVGGLPVVLTLTKCDALSQPGDEPSDWLRRVEERKAEVRGTFEGRFADELAPPADGYLHFGSLELHLAATAKDIPPGPAFEVYADPGGSFGVGDLVETLLPAAQEHHDRETATDRRLRRTAGGVGGVVLALLTGLGLFALAPAGDPLTERVRAYQRREGPPAVRLADRSLPGVRKELTAIQASSGFDRLSAELQAFVRDRLLEAEAYTEFRARFQPPRLGPAEVRSRQQIDQLAADLNGPLALPTEYATAWDDTDAGRLTAKWKTDLSLLQVAESSVHDWYRARIRRGDLLLLTETPPDPTWRVAVEQLLAERLPHDPTEPLPASPTGPGPRGKPLTWAAAYAVDRVAAARRDWDDTAARLTALREVSDAVGLTAVGGSLVFPNPLPKDLAPRVLPGLPSDDRWRVDRFPDPVRGVVANRLMAAFDAGVRGLRPVLPDTHVSLLAPEWRAWGELLKRLAGWARPGTPAADAVQELATFLRRDQFDIDLRDVRVTLPDDLLDPPPTPAGPLTIIHTPAGGSPVTLTLTSTGQPTRDRPYTTYRFSHVQPIVAGRSDTLTAALRIQSGADTRELTWPAGSGPFAFLRLGRSPRLGDAEAAGVRLSAPGLTAPVLLADPGGR